MRTDTLTRAKIVTAAIELLDAEGLEGLNMRALGHRLGSAATAVYWHVGSKEHLIALAGDRVWGEVPLPDIAAFGWRAAAQSMAMELYAMLGRHRWLVQAFGSVVVYGPGKARHDDHSLAIFEAAGFAGAEADQAMATVFTFVLGNTLGPAAAAAVARRLDRGEASEARAWQVSMQDARAIAAEFPRLRERLDASSTEYGASPEHTFEFGLRAVLDGLEARLAGAQSVAT
jgi:AcrR family transcriptional regulator